MGYVYILQSGDTNFFKIGRTEHDVENRIKQLSTGNPHPLTAFHVIETDYASKCETFLHNRLQAKRSRQSDANEFFVIDAQELREEIRMVEDYVANDLPMMAQIEQLASEECEDRWVSPSDAEVALFQEVAGGSGGLRDAHTPEGAARNRAEARDRDGRGVGGPRELEDRRGPSVRRGELFA